MAKHVTRVPLSSEIGVVVGFRLKDLYFRREVQTFHLLSVSGLIVFGVITYMQRLDTLSYYEIVDIQTLVNKWAEDVAIYHERDTWLPVIDKHIKEMTVYHRKIIIGIYIFFFFFYFGYIVL